MAARFERDYALPAHDAVMMTQSKAMAAYFEATAQACGAPKLAANWLMGEVSRRLNADSRDITDSPVSAATLASLIRRIVDATVSNNGARQVFDALWSGSLPDGLVATSFSDVDSLVNALIDALGLRQMNDSGALEGIVVEVLAANQKLVDEFRAGKEKAFNALVGQAMKASKGKANPGQVNELLKKLLG